MYLSSSVCNQPDWWCSWPSCSFHCVSGIGVRTAAIWGRGGFWGPGCPGFYWLKPHSPHAGNCGSGSAASGSAPWKSWERDDRGEGFTTSSSLNSANTVTDLRSQEEHVLHRDSGRLMIIHTISELLSQPAQHSGGQHCGRKHQPVYLEDDEGWNQHVITMAGIVSISVTTTYPESYSQFDWHGFI